MISFKQFLQEEMAANAMGAAGPPLATYDPLLKIKLFRRKRK
jgi:hypothetical protein